MDNEFYSSYGQPAKPKQKYLLHLLLFIVTFVTCTIAGAQWSGKDFTDALNWHYGLEYAVLILTFLSAHEFGHFFAAKHHKVDATLPFYIPFPLPIVINFGTFGAVIRTRTPIRTNKALFDIGAAGPLAGFVVALGFLIYGLVTLPGIDYIYAIHPEYLKLYNGQIPNVSLFFGDTLIFSILAKLFANPNGFLPPMNEIYHYPFLNVGWFGMFVTAMNLLPLGQLDGGHIMKALFGKYQSIIARVFWWFLVAVGVGSLLGIMHQLLQGDYNDSLMNIAQSIFLPILNTIKQYVPFVYTGWDGWLLWAIITKFFIKLDHPEIYSDDDIGSVRKVLGYVCIAILILTFSINGVYFIE